MKINKVIRMSLYAFILVFVSCEISYIDDSFAKKIDKVKIVNEINKMRIQGCNCGEEAKPGVGQIQWNDNLEKAALLAEMSWTLERKVIKRDSLFAALEPGKRCFEASWGVGGSNSGNRVYNEDDFVELAKSWSCLCSMLMEEYVTDIAVIWFDKDNNKVDDRNKGWWRVYLAY